MIISSQVILPVALNSLMAMHQILNTPLKTVQVYDATVGLKGGRAFGIGGQFTDFINGLTFNNISQAYTSQEKTICGRPTGGSNNGEVCRYSSVQFHDCM